MTWHTFDKIITNVLALAFAAGGIVCGLFGAFLFFGSETIFQEICGAALLACGGTLLTSAMLCAIAYRLDGEAQRQRRTIEILEDIEAELTRQGKVSHQPQPWQVIPPPVMRMKS